MKLILILAVVIGALWLLRGTRVQAGTPRGASGAPKAKSQGPVQMVSCAHCGLHLPRDEAFDSPNQLHYCSEAHRIEHMKRNAARSQGSR